jgi:hypothetical protein
MYIKKMEFDQKILGIYHLGYNDCSTGNECYLYTANPIGIKSIAYRMGWNNYITGKEDNKSIDGLPDEEIVQLIYVKTKAKFKERDRLEAMNKVYS